MSEDRKNSKGRDSQLQFTKIKRERDKQIWKRLNATDEGVYVDSSRNISNNQGVEDLKQDMEELGICIAKEGVTSGPSSLMLHTEARHHLKGIIDQFHFRTFLVLVTDWNQIFCLGTGLFAHHCVSVCVVCVCPPFSE